MEMRWALLMVAGALAEHAGCPSQPLRSLGAGRFAGVLTNQNASCASYAPDCPFAVPFPDFPCLVSCVASSSDCVRMNRRTPSVTPADPHVCKQCSITACEACTYTADGEPRCAKCFKGFNGLGGVAGRWKSCELAHVGLVLATSEVLAGIVAVLVILAVVTTCMGACHTDLISSLLRRRRGKAAEEALPVSAEGPQSPLTGSLRQNREAIRTGLHLSMMSSIKYSSKRLRDIKEEEGADGVQATHSSSFLSMGSVKSSLDEQLSDIGLGLQLFYNTQRFFICMALVTWLAALAVGWFSPGHPADVLEGATCNQALHASAGLAKEQLVRAYLQGNGCLLLWVVLMALTLAFHCYQLRFVNSYDKAHHSTEDYTIKLEGLPAQVTSERRLMSVLEEELRMEGMIHGVCICYNVLDLPKPEAVEEMVDRLIELDDLDLGLYGDHIAKARQDLTHELEQDAEQLKAWLEDGTLHGSGTAYVVFKKQRDVARVMMQRRGIAKKVFRKSASSASPTAEDDSPMRDDAIIKVVEISKDDAEPSGVRFEAFQQPHEQHRRTEFLWIPLRMIIYISVYAFAAHVFFLYMIKPWEDNFIIGAESDFGVKLAGKLVLMLNFAVQTLVMMDVERGGFLRTAQVDSITFVWNTILLLVTNFYVIVQEVYRDGYRWVLMPPSECFSSIRNPPPECWDWLRLLFQSVTTEREVGRNLVSVLTDQIMMLYVLGEVANVLMPVIFYWVALRLIYVMNVGGSTDSFFQRSLRAMLPGSSSATTITAREAEKAQVLMPLLLWMEYTYIVIFPAMALVTFYLVTENTSSVCLWLLIFSVLHFFWQRYVMLWLYGKATYDSTESYDAFILMWGLVLSMLPPASLWWAYRRGEIKEGAFAMLSMVLIFFLALLVYRYTLLILGWFMGARDDGIDEMGEDGDPGYESLVNKYGISWWNRNPVYVLKNRHCPEFAGHEVHERHTRCWPKGAEREGFFELGKEFRHFQSHRENGRSLLRKGSLLKMFSPPSKSNDSTGAAAATAAAVPLDAACEGDSPATVASAAASSRTSAPSGPQGVASAAGLDASTRSLSSSTFGMAPQLAVAAHTPKPPAISPAISPGSPLRLASTSLPGQQRVVYAPQLGSRAPQVVTRSVVAQPAAGLAGPPQASLRAAPLTQPRQPSTGGATVAGRIAAASTTSRTTKQQPAVMATRR